MSFVNTQSYDPFMDKAIESHTRLTRLMKKFQNFTANSDILSSDTTMIYLILRSNIPLKYIQIRTILGLDDRNEVHRIIYSGIHKEVKYAAQKLLSITKFSTLLEMPLTNLKHLCYEIALNYKSIFFVPVKARIKVYHPQRNYSSPPDTGSGRNRFQSNPSSYFVPYFRNASDITSETSSNTHYSPEFSTSLYNLPTLHPQEHNPTENTEFVEIIEFISKFNQMWIIAAFLNKEYQELKNQQTEPQG